MHYLFYTNIINLYLLMHIKYDNIIVERKDR